MLLEEKSEMLLEVVLEVVLEEELEEELEEFILELFDENEVQLELRSGRLSVTSYNKTTI